MIYTSAIPGGLLLDNGAARLQIHSAAELKAALTTFRNDFAMKGNEMTPGQTTRPPTAGRRMGHTEELPDPRLPLTRRPPASTDETGAMDFKDAPAPAPDVTEKHISIAIEVTPAGLHIRADYIGPLSSIPAAVARLKAAGVLELVQASSPAPVVAPASKAKVERVVVLPDYDDAGNPCCPKHKKPLKEGQYGLYCSAKDDTTERGYCSLKFKD